MPSFEEQIEAWINETNLMQKSKDTLLKDALKIYKALADKTTPEKEKTELAKSAVILACDKNSCAIGRNIPQTKAKILSGARKRTQIPHAEAIDRVDAICNISKRSQIVADEAKKILSEYKEKHGPDYFRRGSIISAASAVYIASILKEEHITQDVLGGYIGISQNSIRVCYTEIATALNITFSEDQYLKALGKKQIDRDKDIEEYCRKCDKP